jgi:flagellar M-ring protein FliF
MDFLRKLFEQIKNLWGKWTMVQKLVLCGIIVAVIVGIVALLSVSSSPSMVPVINSPITDEDVRDRIVMRISEEGYKVTLSANDTIMVADEETARKMRGILFTENLIPNDIDPWKVFDRERWTLTDLERNINLQRAITQMVTNHLKALNGVDDAKVVINFPKDKLLRSEQNPVSASVTLIATPGSDLSENRKKIEGIQKILRFAVEGLKDENIVITDQSGVSLNDFDALVGWDEQALVERQQKYILQLENRYRAIVLSSLQDTFSDDRVRDLNLKIDMDMSKKAVTSTNYKPTMLKERTPGLAYDDSQMVESITLSESITESKFKGTGFNPEGPAGTEANVMPVMKDMSNVEGEVTQQTRQHNELVSNDVTEEERKPKIDRVTVSVNVDGVWKLKYDVKGKPVILPNGSLEREYTPVEPEVLADTQSYVQDSVGFNAARGDSVTITNIPFDRTEEFANLDAAYFRKRNIQNTILFFLLGLAVLLIAFVVFRLVSKAIERQRLAAEEALARERQAARERALLEAEQDGVEVSMSVEERKRMELQENVISLAKDHPEDAAQLIRTWLLED